MLRSTDILRNRLLAALPDADLKLLGPHLDVVTLPLGRVIFESGDAMTYVYFPLTVIASLLYLTRDGTSAQIAVVGNDGILGVSSFMGGTESNRAVVQFAGLACRLGAVHLKRAFATCDPVQKVLLRYTQFLLGQMGHMVACTRHHSASQQVGRLLLMWLDRSDGEDVAMTHEFIANLLGVRRETVTDAAIKLQREGAIHYVRGHITVVDRARLEAGSCECHLVMNGEFDRLLGARRPRTALPPHWAALREHH